MNADGNSSTRESDDSFMTWSRDGAVKLRMTESGPGSEQPKTVMQALKETVDRVPQRPALAVKVDGIWKMMTYLEYYENICCAARAFIKLGLETFKSVGIIGFNSPEYFIADLGAIFAGGIATGIYTTNSPEACQYVLDNADCQIAVVENDIQLKKILLVRDQLPHLKTIVQYKGQLRDEYKDSDILTWQQFMSLGQGADHDQLELELQKRISAQAPNKCCTLIYTSGTTGNPKGVMTSHDNLTWVSLMIARYVDRQDGEIIISYLPLSHIAGQFADIYLPMVTGDTVYFAQPDALRGSLKTTLLEVRPTTFFGVPRVFEKFQEGITAVGKKNGVVLRSLVGWAKDIGLRSNLANMQQQPRPFLYPVAKALVFDKVRAAVGLDRCRYIISSAAPNLRQTLEFFMSLDMLILEVFGMSECTGPHSGGMPYSNAVTSVGREFPGARTKLVDAEGKIVSEGEICMFGRHVFMGYINMPEKTKEVLDEDGWLHSGDIGRRDENGYLFVTGRIKELVITAGGENVPPLLIEDKVKQTLSCVSHCILIGDKRKFLSMLLTFKTELNMETLEPSEQLTQTAIDWCQSIGSSATTVADIVDKPDQLVMAAVQRGINAVNEQATSKAQCIHKWTILHKDFSIPGGELGPTMKVKRAEVQRLYASTIDKLYTE